MKPTDRARLLNLFRAAAQLSPPATGHIAQDDVLLTAWRTGDLTDAEESQFFGHLEACKACCQVVIELGSAFPPEVTSPSSIAVVPATRPRRLLRTALVALAACLVIGLAWSFSGRESDQFAEAKRDLDAGRAEDALIKLDAVRPRNDKDRAKLNQLLEEAAFSAALQDLKLGRYADAANKCLAVREKGVESGRIANVLLLSNAPQELRVPGELLLAFRPTLLHWGFRPDGTRAAPSSIRIDEPHLTAWKAASEHYPDDEYLRLNYGTLLLLQQRFQAAREVLDTPLLEAIVPTRSLSGSGMSLTDARGIAFFGDGSSREGVERARHAFMADDRHRTSPNAAINTAICLERLGQPADARLLWLSALPQIADPQIKQIIEEHLNQ